MPYSFDGRHPTGCLPSWVYGNPMGEGDIEMTLNLHRVNDWHEAMKLATNARERGWSKVAARWLDTAGVIRANAWKPWDYEVLVWVCQCCMLAHASDGCGDCPEHNGDGLEPLSAIPLTDSLAMGGVHDDDCPGGECGCETITHSASQCRGCGSWLHGKRHAMTLFVNDRRNARVAA